MRDAVREDEMSRFKPGDVRYQAAFGAVAMMLAACAGAPPYQAAASASSSGYSEQVIEADRYRVRFTGKAGMEKSTVQDYALMRAAELTAENGHDWFEVVNRDNDADVRVRRDIETDFGPDYAVTRSCGLLGCTTEARPVLTRSQTETVSTRTIHETVLEIVMGDGAASGEAGVYDAGDTLATLRARLS